MPKLKLAHGTFQGIMTEVNGGSFISGYAAGALSSIASSAFTGTAIDGEGNAIAGTGFKSIGTGAGPAGMIAFGTIAGGAGAALTGGNFWQGAVTGLVVSALNHGFHNGKKINDNGGDTTDYNYDDNGNIIGSTDVKFIGAISEGKFRKLGGYRGYGFKGTPMATGAVTENNTIANLFTGGAVAKGFGSLLSSKSASLVLKYSNTLNKGNWWRLGQGFNPSTKLENIRLAWGAHPDFLQQVPKFYKV